MLTAFFDSEGVVHHEYSRGTVTAESYCDTISRLREQVRRKHPTLWERDNNGEHQWILHHDNASSHTATETIAHISYPGREIRMMPHPPCSPDLAPADFFLFPPLKSKFRGHRFQTLDDLNVAVDRELRLIQPQEFAAAFASLPTRWRKCLAAGGDYFEGQHIDADTDTEFEFSDDSTDPDSDIET